MNSYLIRLLEHIDSRKPLVQVPYKPVSRELLVKLIEYFSLPREDPEVDVEEVHGTNMKRVRTGLILENVVDGVWKFMLGRKCRSISEIRPDARLKSAGGYAKFSQSVANKDHSVKRSLARELEEEGFGAAFRLRSDSVVPLGVRPAKPEGLLQFYSGRLKHYPEFLDEGIALPRSKSIHLHLFNECDDGKKIFVNYFTIDELFSMARPPISLVYGETVEAVVNSYLWQRSRHVHLSTLDNSFAAGDGDLLIPKKTRRYIFAHVGLPEEKEHPTFSRCKVYYSVPNQPTIFSMRLFLATDIFLFEKDFDEADISSLMSGEGRIRDISEAAPKIAREYLRRNYWDILHNDLFAQYVRQPSLPEP